MRLIGILAIAGVGLAVAVAAANAPHPAWRDGVVHRDWKLITEPAEGGWKTSVFDPTGKLVSQGFAPSLTDPPLPGQTSYEGLIEYFRTIVDRIIASGGTTFEESANTTDGGAFLR